MSIVPGARRVLQLQTETTSPRIARARTRAALVVLWCILSTFVSCNEKNWCTYAKNLIQEEGGECIKNPGFWSVGVWIDSDSPSVVHSLEAYLSQVPAPLQAALKRQDILVPDFDKRNSLELGLQGSAQPTMLTQAGLPKEIADRLTALSGDLSANGSIDYRIRLAHPRSVRFEAFREAFRTAMDSADMTLCQQLVRLSRELCQPRVKFAHSTVTAVPEVRVKLRSGSKSNITVGELIGDFRVTAVEESAGALNMIGTNSLTVAADWVAGSTLLGDLCSEILCCREPPKPREQYEHSRITPDMKAIITGNVPRGEDCVAETPTGYWHPHCPNKAQVNNCPGLTVNDGVASSGGFDSYYDDNCGTCTYRILCTKPDTSRRIHMRCQAPDGRRFGKNVLRR